MPEALTARLEFRDPETNSDKVYKLWLQKEFVPGQQPGQNFLWSVCFAYGRRGANLKEGKKTSRPVSYDSARSVFMVVVREKISKGYGLIEEAGNDGELQSMRRTGSQIAGARVQIPAATVADIVLRASRESREKEAARQAEQLARFRNAAQERQYQNARRSRSAPKLPAVPVPPPAPRHTLTPGKRRIRFEDEE